MKILTTVLINILFLSACSSPNRLEIKATPGGIYYLPAKVENVHIFVTGEALSNKPFRIVGTKNRTEILGNSFIKISGVASNISIENVKFINNVINEKESSALIEIGQAHKYTVTDISIKNSEITYTQKFNDQDVATQFFWIKVSANNVRITRCQFENKQNRLPIIHVDANYLNVVIENSAFLNVMPRKGEALEAIRIGLIDGNTNTIIRHNRFSNYHGDAETISCKADGVNISDNVFENSRSGVSVRFANSCIIKNNTFINTINPVRVAGRNNRIIGNTFKGSENSIVLMVGGKDNSPYGYTYPPVNDLSIIGNTFSENNYSLLLIRSGKDSILPDKVRYESNYSAIKSKKIKLLNRELTSNDFEFDKLKISSPPGNVTQEQTTYKVLLSK